MKIDIFKNMTLYKNLEQYNKDIIEVCSRKQFHFAKGKKGYDVMKGGSSNWFDPTQFRECALTTSYPETDPITFNPKFNLILYAANYLALFLINLLYQDKRNTTIEDLCGGAGYLIFYLSKCGFNNLYMTENFTQVSPLLLSAIVRKANIKLHLNIETVEPTVINIVGYPWFEKDWNKSVELFCIYPCDNMFKTIIPEIESKGYKKLCEDSDYLCLAYCREDKFNEFMEKIKSYESLEKKQSR